MNLGRRKNKNIFKKYIAVNIFTVFFSFLILGIMLMLFMLNYWQQEKFRILDKNTESIVELTKSNIIVNNNVICITNINMMKRFISIFSDTSNSDIFISDINGNILLASDVNKSKVISSVPKEVLDEAVLNGFHNKGRLDNFYENDCFIVAQPVFYEDDINSENPVAMVFSISGVEHMKLFIYDALEMFFIAAIVALIVSFIIITFLNYKTIEPLRQMAQAAKSFGQGDFTKRVPVVSSDEIGQLAVEFNNMAESLLSSEGAKRSFIANVSHELKTPMTTIAGFIDGILDGTIPESKQEYYLKIVSQEIKRLSRLVKTMLSLSQIDNKLKLNRQCCDITNMLIGCLLNFENDINSKKINIEGLEETSSIFVYGDPDMLHQVVYNLIENAVKFVNAGGYIRFDIGEKNGGVSIKIKNSGDGISPDEISLIFDKFYKTDKSRSIDKNGMGLGLYIVRKIIRLHGGNITVDSIQGEYCEFKFWIPGLAQKGKDIIQEDQS